MEHRTARLIIGANGATIRAALTANRRRQAVIKRLCPPSLVLSLITLEFTTRRRHISGSPRANHAVLIEKLTRCSSQRIHYISRINQPDKTKSSNYMKNNRRTEAYTIYGVSKRKT